MEKLRDILDLTVGFVLNQRQALEYLKECAMGFYEECIYSGEKCAEAIDDLASMAYEINSEDWEWVRFYECPMSASGISIKEVVDK